MNIVEGCAVFELCNIGLPILLSFGLSARKFLFKDILCDEAWFLEGSGTTIITMFQSGFYLLFATDS